jgi:XapX domain-containing protein
MLPTLIGLTMGLLIGAGCRYFDIPSPAPPRLIGACLLVSMTLGFVAADSFFSLGHTYALLRPS